VDAFVKNQTIKKKESEILLLKKKINRNMREEKLLKSAVIKYHKVIAKIKADNLAIQKQITDISEKVMFLENIQRKKLTANELADLVNELKKYNLKLLSFEKNGDNISLLIVSEFGNSSDIADFMKDMYKLGYKNVESTEIKNKDGIYISKVSYDE